MTKLHHVEAAINIRRLHQLRMGSHFTDPALVHHHDLIGIKYRRQAVRNGNRRLALGEFFERCLNVLLSLGIER